METKKAEVKVEATTGDDVQKALDTLGIKSTLIKSEVEEEDDSEKNKKPGTEKGAEDEGSEKSETELDLIKGEVDGMKTIINDLAKSIDNVVEGMSDIKKAEGESVASALSKADLSGLGGSIANIIGEKLQAIGTIEKSILDQVGVLQKSVIEMAESIEEMAETPMTKKSYDNLNTVERQFNKGGGEGNGAKKILKSKTNRAEILSLFDKMEGTLKKAGDDFNSEAYREAALTFEASGYIKDDMVKSILDSTGALIMQE